MRSKKTKLITPASVLQNPKQITTYLKSAGWKAAQATIYRHAADGKIPARPDGTYSIEDVEAYAADNLERVEPKGETAPPIDAVDACLNPGLDSALVRLRAAEVMAYQRWTRAVESGKAPEAVFKSYAQALELLRKAEKNLLDLQKERGDLVPQADAKEWMLRRVIAAKTGLLDLPGKMAPQLEGLPWPKIQRLLEREIRHAISRLGSDDGAVVGAGLGPASGSEPMAMGGGAS